MKLDAIQMFVAAAEQGSFAAVARKRSVAPSSISRAVADLEAELKLRLFQRTTRRLSLTEAGRAYLERVRPLLEDLRVAHDHARDLDSGPSGLLRVAMAPEMANVHSVNWLPQLRARHPRLQLELVLGAALVDLIAERIDVALRMGPMRPSSAMVRKLSDMPRVLVASPRRLGKRRRLLPEALTREPCLSFPHEGFDGAWKLRDGRGQLHTVVPNQVMVANNGLVLRDLALAGEGFTVLPRLIIYRELATGTLVDAFPDYQVTNTDFGEVVSLMYPSRRYLPLKVKVFVDFMTELFRNGPPWERGG